MLRQSVGRASEMQDLAWSDVNSRFVPDDQVLEMTYFESKTSTITPMTYCSDVLNWELDPLLMMAVTLILFGNCSEGDDSNLKYMFACLRSVDKPNVSNKISKWLQKAVGHVAGVDPKISSHDVRYGGMDDQSRIELLAVICSIVRGGWAYEGDTCAFRYIAKRQDIIRAGRALAGYEVPSIIAPQASLDALTFKDEREKTCLYNLMHQLFRGLPCSDKATDRLFSTKQTFMAVLLENLHDIDSFTRVEGDDGKVVSNVLIETVKTFSLNQYLEYDRLLEWGKQVRPVVVCYCVISTHEYSFEYVILKSILTNTNFNISLLHRFKNTEPIASNWHIGNDLKLTSQQLLKTMTY